jgi:hypothetical protein
VREAVQQVIDGVLNPLLQNDASSIELLDVTEEEVVVRVTGRAAFGVGAEFVRTGVIEPARHSHQENDSDCQTARVTACTI